MNKRQNFLSILHREVDPEKVAQAELSVQYDVQQKQIQDWKKQGLDQASSVFGSSQENKKADAAQLRDLHAKIGELALENESLAKALGRWGVGSSKQSETRTAFDENNGDTRTLPRRQNHTSQPKPQSLSLILRNLEINKVNQVCCTDITDIPLRKVFLYLWLLCWYSRKVLSWRLSNSLDTAPCLEALEQALAKHGKPDIFNSDQGCQFTSNDFTGIIKNNGIQISMDGKGRWIDKVCIQRLWRTLNTRRFTSRPMIQSHRQKRVCDLRILTIGFQAVK